LTIHIDTDDPIEACFDRDWTDGLPVVPPTPDRVERMLGPCVGRADETVAVLPPAGGAATLKRIAANAVMAGCHPEAFPVVEAAVRAIADPAFQLERVLTSLHSRSPMVVVSGPIARALGMNGGFSALGAGNRANATIGRAVNLVCRSIAGSRPGGLNPATLGHPGSFTFCLTENVADSPWAPIHTSFGFDKSESVVSVYAADAPVCIAEVARLESAVLLELLAAAVALPGTYNALHQQDLWLVLSPTHASVLDNAGVGRESLARHLHEHARIPAHLVPVDRIKGGGLFEGPPAASTLAALAEGGVPVVDRPERVRAAVAGSRLGGYTAVIFGSGVTVSVAVEAAGGSGR
jgi:hypothetical protein